MTAEEVGALTEIGLTVNGEGVAVDVSPQMPLLWVLRDEMGLTGTKYGCGIGLCGACTVHVDGAVTRSCVTPVAVVAGHEVTTIEGLGINGLHPLQEAFIELNVAQCGYCQPGQVMTAAGLLAVTPDPSPEEVERTMRDVLCRCGTYSRIERAIALVAERGR